MANIIVTLPDGKQLSCVEPLNISSLAMQISRNLAKKAVAGYVNGVLVDLSFLIEANAEVKIVAIDDSEGLNILRHSAAHLLAHAVKELYPEAQPVIGPVIEDGFYYDFYYPQGFSEKDLNLIEQKMHEISARDLSIEKITMLRNDAIDFWQNRNEIFKVKILQDLPENETITLYKQGDFIDLCRGPHVSNVKMLKAFKLTKLAGAYWRGDANNEVLQRIYGVAWQDQKSLDEYLKRIEEAKLRDHRLLGQKMDLFHIQSEAPGMIFWHPNGWTIYKELRNYVAQRLFEFGYYELCTPQIIDKVLWEKSGHWDKYSNNMFVTESEKSLYAIKPMNCPGHIEIFKQGLKSYRDLPLRYAEFGYCHRNEHSGTLHGLFRVRGFTQDDGHIFCTEEQIASESIEYLQQLRSIYADFGFNDVILRLSTRPEKRIGDDSLWEMAEQGLAQALNELGLAWEYNHGDGAFYGPKIEVSLKDCLGRIWQCGTLQLDFFMAERLGAYYIDSNGEKKTPVVLHRAVLGSFERFIGILIEHTAGNLPLWLSPIQAVVLNITDEQIDYAKQIASFLRKANIRAEVDVRNEKIGFKIREHSMRRVPYLLVIGNKEMQNNEITVRRRDGTDLGSFTIGKFTELLKQEIHDKK